VTRARWQRRFLAPQVTFPVWARDEPQRLLYSSNASGKWELYTWDRVAGRHRQVTDRPAGTSVGLLDPTGRWVWWWDDTRGDEFGRWRREAFLGGPPEDPAPALPPAYTAGLLLGRDFAVIGSSRPNEGVTVDLQRPGEEPRRLYAHRRAANLAALSWDDSLVCLSHTEEGDSLHRALRVLDLDGRTVAELSDGLLGDLQAGAFAPIAGDQRLIVRHQRGETPVPMVWDAASGAERHLLLDLPGEVAASWFPDGRRLLLVHQHHGRSELYEYDLDTDSRSPIDTPPGSIGAARVRPDGELWYAWNSSASPPEVRSAAGEVVLRRPGRRPPKGVPYRSYAAGRVPLFVATPRGRGPFPTVFQVHGGPTGHDTDSYAPHVQAWVDHGYAVVLVNYRGSTGYGREWRDGNIGNPGPTELEDIAAAHDFLVQEGIADPARSVLAGGSWGGYVTLLGLGTQPERWALGIAGVPIADWLEQYEDVMEPLKAYDRALFGGGPDEIPEVYRRCSPATYVENVRVPVLILAGENDPRCPIRQVNSYVEKLERLEKPHQVYRYQAGHGSLLVEETLKQMEMRLAFASRHLSTPPPA
jgi:dipeptidyl aminopeptidase/acylaminoacyl peptidase